MGYIVTDSTITLGGVLCRALGSGLAFVHLCSFFCLGSMALPRPQPLALGCREEQRCQVSDWVWARDMGRFPITFDILILVWLKTCVSATCLLNDLIVSMKTLNTNKQTNIINFTLIYFISPWLHLLISLFYICHCIRSNGDVSRWVNFI